MYDAAKRLEAISQEGKEVHVLYLGDHDPSGIDMSRDIEQRLHQMSYGTPIKNARLALNWDQVQQYTPPPNPTKLTDSRATNYIEMFGMESWELDALEPAVLHQIVEDRIIELLDMDKWDAVLEREAIHKDALELAQMSLEDEFRDELETE